MSPEVRRTDPPYVQIADQIRKDIAAGRIKEGEAIPSARHIASTWNVALATATKVLALLRSEGLVEAVRGVGTVVAPNRSGFGSHERLTATRSAGLIYAADEKAEILTAEVVAAPDEIATALALSLGENAIRRERVTRRDAEIVSFSVSWFNASYAEVAPRLLECKRIRKGSFAYIEEMAGVRVTRSREQFYAAAATEDQASRLSVPDASPVMVSKNWFLADDATVVEYGESVRIAGRMTTHEFTIA